MQHFTKQLVSKCSLEEQLGVNLYILCSVIVRSDVVLVATIAVVGKSHSQNYDLIILSTPVIGGKTTV